MVIFNLMLNRGYQESSGTLASEPLSRCFRQRLHLHPRTFPCTVCTWTCPALSYILTSERYGMELEMPFPWTADGMFQHMSLTAVSLANISLPNSTGHASDHIEVTLWWRKGWGLPHTIFHLSVSPLCHAPTPPPQLTLASKRIQVFSCLITREALRTPCSLVVTVARHYLQSVARLWSENESQTLMHRVTRAEVKLQMPLLCSCLFSLFCYLSETGNTGVSCLTGWLLLTHAWSTSSQEDWNQCVMSVMVVC